MAHLIAGFLLLMSVFCGGIALLLASAWRDERRKLRRSLTWSQAPGTVVDSTVRRYVGEYEGAESISYAPQVGYEYWVNGKKLTGRRVRFGGESQWGFAKVAARRLGGYRMDVPVTVYYDPADPRECVLERTVSSAYLGWSIFLGSLALAEAALAVTIWLSSSN